MMQKNKFSLLIVIAFLLVLPGCTGKSSGQTVYTAKEESYQKFINQKELRKVLSRDENYDLGGDKTIVNNDYPIEIALYSDKSFFYDLPNLGTGSGTWRFTDGKIELKAKRSIFDMYIEVYGGDAEINSAVIQFRDRFGFNSLPMQNNNI